MLDDPLSKRCEGMCPHCGSGNVSYDPIEMLDSEGGFFRGDCDDCGGEFKEWYNMTYADTEYYPIEEEEEEPVEENFEL